MEEGRQQKKFYSLFFNSTKHRVRCYISYSRLKYTGVTLRKINPMNWQEYLQQFDEILNHTISSTPYNDPHFYEYTKLNQSRMNRWLKTASLQTTLVDALQAIQEPQQWILITEPWCGDAAHLNPFIFKMSEVNPHIQLQIQLRDSGSEIDDYLTNGGKAIPKLIIRNENAQDLLVWGPRPAAAQAYFYELKESAMPLEAQKAALQQWYNQDKGQSIQQEFIEYLKKDPAALDSTPTHSQAPLDVPIG